MEVEIKFSMNKKEIAVLLELLNKVEEISSKYTLKIKEEKSFLESL